MLGLKLNHVSKRGPRPTRETLTLNIPYHNSQPQQCFHAIFLLRNMIIALVILYILLTRNRYVTVQSGQFYCHCCWIRFFIAKCSVWICSLVYKNVCLGLFSLKSYVPMQKYPDIARRPVNLSFGLNRDLYGKLSVSNMFLFVQNNQYFANSDIFYWYFTDLISWSLHECI